MICNQCGNDFVGTKCPFCNYLNEKLPKATISSFQTINIKDDMPIVDVAISRTKFAINDAKRKKNKLLKIIHGYGSSGKGGYIKTALQDEFRSMKWNGTIKAYIRGEDFRNSSGTKFKKMYPKIAEKIKQENPNKGVTFILVF